MSLINCPECGNECSSSATACPSCGHPFIKKVEPPRVIVKEVVEEDAFPKWIFIPLAILGAIVLFVIFMMLQKDETADQKNINVNLAGARQTERLETTTSTVSTSTPTTTVQVPSSSVPSTVSIPQTVSTPSTVTSVPSGDTASSVSVPTDKGTVSMEAKILNRTGTAQPVSRVKFYLLDKDLDSILSEANIEDELGQGLINAFGVSVANPDKYGEVSKKAFAAINKHIVYSTTTDGSGKANIKDVKPKNYYLFAVTPTRNGFALWNSPIMINTGQNSLILDPVTPTEIVSENE